MQRLSRMIQVNAESAHFPFTAAATRSASPESTADTALPYIAPRAARSGSPPANPSREVRPASLGSPQVRAMIGLRARRRAALLRAPSLPSHFAAASSLPAPARVSF